MNTLEQELAEHAKVLESFKDLPVDLKKEIRSYFHSVRPDSVCPVCKRLHYPFFCNHYCQPECLAKALKKMLWYQNIYYSSGSEGSEI
mgnify:CR=1 FL=1